MRFTFSISTMDAESNAATQAEVVLTMTARDDQLGFVGTVAEILFKGYESWYPLSERDPGEELTLVGVTGGCEDEPLADDCVIGYYDAHFKWEPLVGDLS